LQGAVLLQPLTAAQVDDYLNAYGSKLAVLRELVQRDTTLQELARSPLMLSIISLAYADAPREEIEKSDTTIPEDRRTRIFDNYIAAMFRRRSRLGFNVAQTRARLTWLARNMEEHNQSIFLLEQMQPTWLSTKVQRILYAIATRVLTGI